MATSTLKILARLGYAARGVVYLLIGCLAFVAALGQDAGRAADPRSALASLLSAPMGLAIVLAIALGLLAYALWKTVQSLLDADGNGTGCQGLAVGCAMLVSAVTHASLGLYALALPYTRAPRGDGSNGAAALLLQQPFGQYSLAAVAAVVIGAGCCQCWKGWTGGFRKHLAIEPRLMRKLAPICAFGLIARGVVFVIVGGFLLVAALSVDPGEAGGTAGAMNWLHSLSHGRYLVAIIAIGLVAFGLYGMLQAVWRRLDLACHHPRRWDGPWLAEGWASSCWPRSIERRKRLTLSA